MAKVTKTVTRDMAENWLGDVSVEKQFWSQDGRVFRNLQELRAAPKDMHPDAFKHHVNESRNDLANWVGEVIGDGELSAKLGQATTSAEAVKVLTRRMAVLKRKLSAQ
jgi:hypothetical protein